MWSSFENPLLAPYSCGMGSSIELDTNTELHSITPICNTEKRWYFLFLCDSSLFSLISLSLKLFYTSAKSQLYQMLIHLHAYTQALLWEYGFFKAFIHNLI